MVDHDESSENSIYNDLSLDFETEESKVDPKINENKIVMPASERVNNIVQDSSKNMKFKADALDHDNNKFTSLKEESIDNEIDDDSDSLSVSNEGSLDLNISKKSLEDKNRTKSSFKAGLEVTDEKKEKKNDESSSSCLIDPGIEDNEGDLNSDSNHDNENDEQIEQEEIEEEEECESSEHIEKGLEEDNNIQEPPSKSASKKSLGIVEENEDDNYSGISLSNEVEKQEVPKAQEMTQKPKKSYNVNLELKKEVASKYVSSPYICNYQV